MTKTTVDELHAIARQLEQARDKLAELVVAGDHTRHYRAAALAALREIDLEAVAAREREKPEVFQIPLIMCNEAG